MIVGPWRTLGADGTFSYGINDLLSNSNPIRQSCRVIRAGERGDGVIKDGGRSLNDQLFFVISRDFSEPALCSQASTIISLIIS